MSLGTTNQGLQKTIEALRKRNNQAKKENQLLKATLMFTQKTLFDYLAELNSSDSQWGIWVNPEDINQYRLGQFIFDNGGLLDGWVCIGSLDRLSFGYQSMEDAIAEYLEKSDYLYYQDKKILFNKQGILLAYGRGFLDQGFQAFLEEQASLICFTWAREEAEGFIYNQLPEILEQAKLDKVLESL